MKKSLFTLIMFIVSSLCSAQTILDFDFIPTVTDNNMSAIFGSGVLAGFEGALLQGYIDGQPVSASSQISNDGTGGVAVIGTDDLCSCDYAQSGDEITFSILADGYTIVNIETDLPLNYIGNYWAINWWSSISFSIDGNPLVFGCMDLNYLEYDPQANFEDGYCVTPIVFGCTEPNALNYEELANTDDESCIPIEYGCTEFHALNFNPDANVDYGSCEMPYFESFDFIPISTDNNMSVVFGGGVLAGFEGALLQGYIDGHPVSVSSQILNDGAGGVAVIGTDALCACDYAQNGNEITFSILAGGYTIVNIETDPPLYYQANTFYMDWWSSISFTVDGNPIIEGCTNSSYVEYNPDANLYDGSCQTRAIYGCIDALACNYINADIDDGSCIYPGCTDSNFIEYFNQGFTAGCDNGSCDNLVEDLDLIVANFQEPMVTGNSMNIGFDLPYIEGVENATIAAFYDLNGDGIINTDTYTANNGLNFSECVGLSNYSNDFFTLALWGDDSTTDAVEGLQSGQNDLVFALLTADNQVIAFNLDPELPAYIVNGTFVVNNIDFDVVIYGCMNSNDCNYKPEAEEDDGSCIGIPDCKDLLYFEYNESAGCNNQAMCLNSWQDLYYTALDSASLAFAIDEAEDQAFLYYVLDSAAYAYALDEAEDQFLLDSTQSELDYWRAPIMVDLNVGWNMIGYTFNEPQDVVATLNEISEIIEFVKDNEASVYWPQFGFNGIGDFIPGQGYQFKVYESYTGFYFPDVNGQRFDLVPTVPQWAIDIQVDLHPNDIRTLVKVVNMLGQEVNPETQSMGTILLYLYNDATVEKMMTK